MDIKEKLKVYLNQYLEEKSLFNKTKNTLFSGVVLEECTSNIREYIEDEKDDYTFQTKLFHYIDTKNLKDSDVYNKVYMDRRLFSKIRGNKDYHPSKETVILLGLALELTEYELEDLLASASYFLPKNNTFDLIIRFCFKEKIYNIDQVNEFLYDYDCKMIN